MTTTMTRERRAVEYGGYGVNLQLPRDNNTPEVYWSKDSQGRPNNSYVVATNPTGPWKMDDGTRVDLVSINGIGEIRWRIEPPPFRDLDVRHEPAEAVDYFRLARA